MSKIFELRNKRNTLWEQTKAFLEEHRDTNGLVEASAVEQYNKMKDTGIESDISTILIEIDSAWLGKTVQEVEDTFHVDIVMVRQGDQVMHPRPDYVLHLSDAVAIYKK